MASAYTPTLLISKSTLLTKLRQLPVAGDVLVEVGSRVEATTDVLAADRPGEVEIVRIADRMGVLPEDVVSRLLVQPGQTVDQGQLLCEIKTFFGLFTVRCQSPLAGTVEFFTESNAHLGIRRPPKPLRINSYVEGFVSEVEAGRAATIETWGAFIQGVFGVGGERQGKLYCLSVAPSQVVTVDEVKATDGLSGSVLVGGRCFTVDALRAAADAGVVAVVTGSIESLDLEEFLGHPFSLSVTGDEELPLSLIVTEGFGQIDMSQRVAELAQEHHGRPCSCNGATQVRAGAVRPELIIPRLDLPRPELSSTSLGELNVGSRVRVVRVPYFGAFGTITALPSGPVRIETGAEVRVLELQLDGGEKVVVPRANVELI